MQDARAPYTIVPVVSPVALRVEARALGIDLGDPADLGADAAERARTEYDRIAQWYSPCEVALWCCQWRGDGGAT